MEVLYTLDYKVKKIIPNNGYHACFADNETTGNGIFDIYTKDGDFIASKNFLKGDYTGNPSVNMYKAVIQSANSSLAFGVIDTETNGYWSALRLYDTTSSPIQEKITYNTPCVPYLVNGVYYGVFLVFQNNDMMSTGWNFPYTGGISEFFIAPLNSDLSLGNWMYPITLNYPTLSGVENIQAMPNGNLLVSLVGDFSPPFERSSLAIEIDSTTGEYVGIVAEGYSGSWNFYRYDYTTSYLYANQPDTYKIYRYDTDGNILNYSYGVLFGNFITNIQFVNNQLICVNMSEFGQTTHLSKDLILGYTTPSFEFNSNFLVNSGWMNDDGSQIVPVTYTGDGMQIGTTSLPNITDWNTVVCKMTNTEPLALRGTLSDADENILAVKNHQIYNNGAWIEGYYQSTLIFKNEEIPNINESIDENWIIAAPNMEMLGTPKVQEITRNGETFKGVKIVFRKIDATGVNLVEVAMEVIIKGADEVGMEVDAIVLNKKQTILYPNPTSNFFKIKTERQKASITIYNTLGQTVAKYNWSKSNNAINISHLKNGTYFVSIKTNKGLTFQKIIKE